MGTLVGVISDTHGLLRPEAIASLMGSSLILHAGDIGRPEVLAGLRSIAPTVAVRGNNDKGDWAETIAERETVVVENLRIYLLHISKELDFEPQAQGIQVVISGHSHKPAISENGGVLWLNPGSAGPRRFKLPISVAQLHVTGTTVESKIIDLNL